MWAIIRCAAAAGLLVVAFYTASVQLDGQDVGRRLRAAEGGDSHGRRLTACDISGEYTYDGGSGYSFEQTGGIINLYWPDTTDPFVGTVNDDCTGTINFGDSHSFEFNPSTLTLTVAGLSFHQVVPTPLPTPAPVLSTPEPTEAVTPAPTALVIATPVPTTPTPAPTAATPTPTLAPGNVVVVDTPAPTVAATPMPTAAETPAPTEPPTPEPTVAATPQPTVGACATTDISGHYIPEDTEDDYTLVQSGSSITLSIGASDYDGSFNSNCAGTVAFSADSVENFVYEPASGNLVFSLSGGTVINFVFQEGEPPVTVVDTPMPTMDSSTPMPTMMDSPTPSPTLPATYMPTPSPTATPEPTKAPRVRQVMIKMRENARMCLDAKARRSKNGKMHMWPCDGDNKNQHWDYTKATGQLKLHDGLCLHFKAAEDKAKVVTFPCKDGQDGQQWKYKRGQFRAMPQTEVDGNFCLDAVKGSEAGGKVMLTKCKKKIMTQKFNMKSSVFDYKEEAELNDTN